MAVGGCGYTIVSKTPDESTLTLAVSLFENRTFEPLLEARVTERVKSRLVSSGPWRIVNQPTTADVVIQGVVTGFGVTPVSFDDANRALEQRVTITAEVTATRRGDSPGAPLFRKTLAGTAEYTAQAESVATREAENRAIEEAGGFLAQELVSKLLGQLSRPDGAKK